MITHDPKIKVMIAGIGGASLGTEIAKCLQLAGGYEIFGCDISPTAYGLYDSMLSATFLVNQTDYLRTVVSACKKAGASVLIPGGEAPMALLAAAVTDLAEQKIRLMANCPEVIRLCTDKAKTFEKLAEQQIRIPRTREVREKADISFVGLPCIIKPATGTGGSVMVFFAQDLSEAITYAEYIKRMGGYPIAQEYLAHSEGEFTVGVLSMPDTRIAGSIALKRNLDNKLSVQSNARGGLVSSGYTQGYIGDFPKICQQAEHIARLIGSRGPLNIQGRVDQGLFIPFELNPRFSASTYLRAMAGFNEVDYFIRQTVLGESVALNVSRPGWYLRSFKEQYVPELLRKEGGQ